MFSNGWMLYSCVYTVWSTAIDGCQLYTVWSAKDDGCYLRMVNCNTRMLAAYSMVSNKWVEGGMVAACSRKQYMDG